MDLYSTNVIIQGVIAVATVIGVFLAFRRGREKQRAISKEMLENQKEALENQKKILTKLGLRLSEVNSVITNENAGLLQEIFSLSKANSSVEEIRKEAYDDFRNAETHGDQICENHKKLDKKREDHYKKLKGNNDEIMKLVTKIQLNNNKILENNRAVS